jgi:hypothetical protein
MKFDVETIKRLYMVSENDIKVLKGSAIPDNWKHPAVKAVFSVNNKITNIVCADGLKYNYGFYNQR